MTAKIISIKNSPLMLYMLITGIVLSALIYIYCVNASVRNVVSREEVEAEMASLQNKVSELEYQYIREETRITLESARALGLSEPENKIFLSKKATGKALSLRE